jgi:hypothetical protein
LLLSAFIGVDAKNLHAETITFEESIPLPDTVTTQYCGKGVEISGGGRIFQPSVTTASPTHALYNDLGQELDTSRRIDISFTTGQTEVSVNVGLDRDYPYITSGVWAELEAFSSRGGSLTNHIENLGNQKIDINKQLKVSDSNGNIRSVRITFGIPSTATSFAIEVIDDLSFSNVGPSCSTVDTADPAVQIEKPDTDGQTTHNPNIELAFKATDDVGVGRIQVQYLDTSDGELASFSPIGAVGKTVSYHFFSQMPEDTQKIRVKAWDFSGKTGKADRTINLTDPGPNMNLWAMAMEVTQGIQPWLAQNTQKRSSAATPPTSWYPVAPSAVPLVADRSTVVRLFGGVEDTAGGMSALNARASLTCFTDVTYFNSCPGPAVLFPTDQPPGILREIVLNPTDSLDTKRRDTRLSWNFELPDEWIKAGTIYLEGHVGAPIGTSECTGCGDAANSIRIRDVQFNTVPDFTDLALLVPIGRNFGGTVDWPTQAQMDPYLDYLRRTYPVDETTVPARIDKKNEWTYNQKGSQSSKECGKLHGEMHSHFKDKLAGREGRFAVHGFIRDFACSGQGGGGIAYTQVGGDPNVAAEEIGHAFGLSHAGPPPGHGAECDYGCDQDWPWPHGGIGAFGFDVLNLAVIPKDRPECQTPGATCDDGIDNDVPADGRIDEECATQIDTDPPADLAADPHDFMSYGSCTLWISPRTWIRLYNALTDSDLAYPKQPGSTSTAAALTLGASDASISAESPAESSGQYLLVRGEEDDSGNWTLLPAYELVLPTGSSDEPGTGEYSIDLKDAIGTVLSQRQFSVEAGHIDMDDPSATLPAPPSFSEVLPLPAGVVSIVVRHETEILANRSRSPNPPTLQLLSPTQNGFDGQPDHPRILWTASDIDNDDLFFMVDYSPTSSWEPLTLDLTSNELAVSLPDLAGGAEAMVRVLATDGFNTSTAVSPTFVVLKKAPQTEILSPVGYSLINEGDWILLRGTAADREDGLLPASAFTWDSHQEGMLGTGRRIGLSTLGPGLHQITLEATDSDGAFGADTVWVEVAKRANTQPVADAGPDQMIPVGQMVRLNGSASGDVDDDPLAYSWSVVAQPQGTNPTLTGDDTEQPHFSVSMTGDYAVQLIVHDGEVESLPDTVNVQVRVDSDGDGVPDPVDNCPGEANANQEDLDGDSHGDACDTCTDTDGDGYGNAGFAANTCATDNCPDAPNPDQSDVDGDNIGDVCDPCDNRPITGTVSASPELLWPPNHKMVPVTIDASTLVTRNQDTQIRVTSVDIVEHSKGSVGAYEENQFEPDWESTGDLSLDLRSERAGGSAGRIYVITVTASDCSGDYDFVTHVTVPHDKGTRKRRKREAPAMGVGLN